MKQFVDSNRSQNESLIEWLSEKNSDENESLMVRLMAKLDLDPTLLSSFPTELALPMRAALNRVRNSKKQVSDAQLGQAERRLIEREDLMEDANVVDVQAVDNITSAEDGMEDLETCHSSLLLWPFDRRLADARSMLQSSSPVPVTVTQRPEVSDHDFVEEQERSLHAICVRTMALPVGRGALTLFLNEPLASEPMPVPKLCMTGKAPPRGATVEMEHIGKWSNGRLCLFFVHSRHCAEYGPLAVVPQRSGRRTSSGQKGQGH